MIESERFDDELADFEIWLEHQPQNPILESKIRNQEDYTKILNKILIINGYEKEAK